MRNRSFIKLLLWALFIIIHCLMIGCSFSRTDQQLNRVLIPEMETIYVLPFEGTLVPSELQETFFNEFVDILNDNRVRINVRQFEILKDDIKEIDKGWVEKQTFVRGELWSFIENASCCQTELRIKSKLILTEPGKQAPTLDLSLPIDGYFDHDESTLEVEKQKLAKRLARELAARVLSALLSRK